MTDDAWTGAALAAARPQALAALARRFRDLDVAEEAFQEACLRALRTWPVNGPPRDPTGWLVMVGRNAAVDRLRKTTRETELPEDRLLSDLDDAEARAAERMDEGDYRDDVLRLLFVCCHPDLSASDQIALALRIVSGLTTPQIARAFLVGDSAMEQRITRAKARIAAADVPFEAPGAVERAERVGAVLAMIYLVFNEGYSARGGPADLAGPLCDEAIRLGRLVLKLFPAEPEVMGLLSLMLLQHARTPARFDAQGDVAPLDEQDRSLWRAAPIAEGLALIDKAMRHARPGPYQVQAAIAALHARSPRPEETDWRGVERLYAALELMQPSPVITLNRAVAVAKVDGAEAALTLIEPLAPRLAAYPPFHGARGGFLLQLGRPDEARAAFDRAVALASGVADASHIRRHLDRLLREFARPAVGREPLGSSSRGGDRPPEPQKETRP